jgi:hypothetical protein
MSLHLAPDSQSTSLWLPCGISLVNNDLQLGFIVKIVLRLC